MEWGDVGTGWSPRLLELACDRDADMAVALAPSLADGLAAVAASLEDGGRTELERLHELALQAGARALARRATTAVEQASSSTLRELADECRRLSDGLRRLALEEVT